MRYLAALSIISVLSCCMAKPNTLPKTKNLINLINQKQSTWVAEENFPEDISIEDIKRRIGVLGVHPDASYTPNVKTHKVGRVIIPESFDAREAWPACHETISNIRDQGNCGSCWAFGACEVMSDRLCIQTNGSVKFQFSPEDLISCCSDCGDGCDGGYSITAWQYWVHSGIVSGGDYDSNQGCRGYSKSAYLHNTTPACQQSCQTKYKTSYYEDQHLGASYYQLRNDVLQIQTEIMTNGPVQASYSVYEDFAYYQTGVYQHVTGEKLGNHAVKILGWGVENGTNYWLVANSWGTEWAKLSGFFKILRGQNDCGIEESVLAGLAKISPTLTTSTTTPTLTTSTTTPTLTTNTITPTLTTSTTTTTSSSVRYSMSSIVVFINFVILLCKFGGSVYLSA